MILVERWSQKSLFITELSNFGKENYFSKKTTCLLVKKIYGIGPSVQL
jgi:hypothetical protein